MASSEGPQQRWTATVDYLSQVLHAVKHVPDPEFAALFIDKPHEVATLLRQFQLARDPRRFSLVTSLPWHRFTPANYAQLVLTGLPLAIVNLLADDEWHEEIESLHTRGENSLTSVGDTVFTSTLKLRSWLATGCLCTRYVHSYIIDILYGSSSPHGSNRRGVQRLTGVLGASVALPKYDPSKTCSD